MDNTELKNINDLITSKDWIRLTEKVSAQPDSLLLKGKIEVNTPRGVLNFDIAFSNDFPLGKVLITCTNVAGYLHQMPNGSLCLNTAPAKTIESRLELELERLQTWINKYYVKEIPDSHFEYYLFHKNTPLPVIFEEDSDKEALKGDFGKFSYSLLNERKINTTDFQTFVAMDLGGRKCRWSNSFTNSLVNKYCGLWIYIKRPPIVQRRETIRNWKDLLDLMSNQQSSYLYAEYKSLMKKSFFPGGFLLMVGYDIPNATGTEIHWETVTVILNQFPYESEKIGPGLYQAADKGFEILWGHSKNASYKRMFGRGKLPDALTESKILIIGTGAIGSSLFMSLVRGGSKFVDIHDSEDVEPGNICRGEFAFRSSYFQKTKELQYEAIATSPFIEIKAEGNIDPIRKDNIAYSTIKTSLMKYDYIFDCTTDKYLSIMLDEMELRGTILNFSISNEAENLVIVAGAGNIHIVKNAIYERLPDADETFYVATGCWHPTFKASHSDINVLLHYALNEISGRILKEVPISSFVISKESNSMGHLNYSIDYNV